MSKLGKGKTPVRCHCSMVASMSGVHMRSGLSGVPARSSVTGRSLYGQHCLCLVQLRLDPRISTASMAAKEVRFKTYH